VWLQKDIILTGNLLSIFVKTYSLGTTAYRSPLFLFFMSRVSHGVVQCNAVTISFLLTVFTDDGIPFTRLTDLRNI
jgi:hypothetical protein